MMRYHLLASISDEIDALLAENDRLRSRVDHLEKLKAITDEHMVEAEKAQRKLTGDILIGLMRGPETI